jgi:serine/threonine-protein kinase
MSLETGQIIEGKYRIVRLIGEGGMGAVYEGENVRIKRRVAIKVLHAATASNAEAVQRFEREAQAAGRIGSDHILEVLDLGTLPNGDRFMVMEYLDGEPLSGRIARKGRLTPQEVAPLAKQVLAGLAAAHSAGIIHRDLKPDNIYILREKAGQPDFVKIIDFGISKFQASSGEMHMTRTGAVMGTPYYMSPEQANGSREADARSDLYAVGVILYECVTGQVPFEAKSFNELLFKIVLAPRPSPLEVVPGLDPAFASLIAKAMLREVEERFQSTAQFSQAIDEWQRSGAGVAVPADVRPSGRPGTPHPPAPAAMPQPAMAQSGMGRTGVKTADPWATSQGNTGSAAVAAPKSSGSTAAVIGIAAVVLLAGVGFAAFKVLGSSSSSDTGATVANQPPPSATPAPTPVKPAEPPPTAEIKPAETAGLVPVTTASTEPAKPGAAVAIKPVVKPVARPVPAAPKPGAHPPAGHPAPGSGTPDFGY